MRTIVRAAAAAAILSSSAAAPPAFADGPAVGPRVVARAFGPSRRAFPAGRFARRRGPAYGAFGDYGVGGGYDDPFADQENGLPPGYEANPSNYPPPRAAVDGAYGSGAYHPTSYGFTTHEAEGMPDQGWSCRPYAGSRPGVRRVCEQ